MYLLHYAAILLVPGLSTRDDGQTRKKQSSGDSRRFWQGLQRHKLVAPDASHWCQSNEAEITENKRSRKEKGMKYYSKVRVVRIPYYWYKSLINDRRHEVSSYYCTIPVCTVITPLFQHVSRAQIDPNRDMIANMSFRLENRSRLVWSFHWGVGYSWKISRYSQFPIFSATPLATGNATHDETREE